MAIRFFPLLFLVFALTAYGQESKKPKKVKTIGVFVNEATKSGYKINDYFVELTESEFALYKGKKVKVTGTLVVVKGIDPNSKIIVQGSTSDRKFITNYTIKVLKN